jgi:hypothetical protein
LNVLNGNVAFDDVAADERGVAGLQRLGDAAAIFLRVELRVVDVLDFRLEAARLEMSDPGAAAPSSG